MVDLPNRTLADRAYHIRRYAVRMGEVQGQGYIAQALDIADILAVAWFHAMTYRADDPDWEGRDRFLLSNGHYAIALYAANYMVRRMDARENFFRAVTPMVVAVAFVGVLLMRQPDMGAFIVIATSKEPSEHRHVCEKRDRCCNCCSN
jgi:hypothetical protein